MTGIELVRFGERRVALALGDYLQLQGIGSRLEQDGDETVLMLLHEGDEVRAREELERFLQDPAHPRYWEVSWQTGRLEEGGGASATQPAWWRMLLSRAGPVTAGVALLCLGVFLFMISSRENAMMVIDALIFPEQIGNADLLVQPWRFLTPVLLHFSLIHILFNLMWWWDLGGLVERTQSGLQLLGVALCTAFVSNLMQFQFSGPNFGGLSGVVYGLLGYVWVYPWINPSVGFRLRHEIVIFMMVWLLVGFSGILDSLIGPMANAAHGFGLLSGLLLGGVFGLAHRQAPQGE